MKGKSLNPSPSSNFAKFRITFLVLKYVSFLASIISCNLSTQPFYFLPPVRLMLTPRVLGTCCCVLLLQVLYRMKKLIGGVKRAFSSGPSS
jgi:hypothetical protein